ncbi:MAG TPA: multidrug efflux RND transporter permease subunit [Alphaproteobacteria bacterium]|nr:multidrug efflux RND transporter permease subunit [Alphaproteobacteria bacterium]
MNFSRFFIDRPIFAGVLSMLVFLCGLIAMPLLPISEYPEVVPPSVVVRAQFPGASPNVIAQTVATPLEEQINGVENMLYMSSQSTVDGSMTLTATFKLGTDPDYAQQLVQNRVNQALPRLPDIVRQIGVSTAKSSPNFIMVVHLVSPNGRYDTTYLRNYAVLNVKNALVRINGIGEVVAFGGGDYAMRLWLDPNKLAARGLTAIDVTNAVREQNNQAAVGSLGGQPMKDPLAFELPITSQGRLHTVEEFENIIVSADQRGGVIRLKEVARVELAPNTYSPESYLDGKQAAAIGVFQAPGSNALALSSAVRQAMEEVKKNFPEGVEYRIVYDPTEFVRTSIEKVIHTLLEAIALVVLVVIVFLQTWRASIIPLLAVPVSIIGTFAVLHVLGFSINNLTLFGLVLAIGIVVDDAIVVVENVERNIREGRTPREATYQAMREVSGPIIAIALTLCAVFVPLAFISGLTGQFYKQFAVTIAISTVISAFNSLTLSPALTALLLKDEHAKKDGLTKFMDRFFGRFFTWFNGFFHRTSDRYVATLDKFVHRRKTGLGLYGLIVAMAALGLWILPTGYVPLQDKQYLVGFSQLPPGASLDRTRKVIDQMSEIGMNQPGVAHSVAFPGLSISGFTASSNAGIVFFPLKPFEERTSWDMYGPAIAGALSGKGFAIQDAFSAIFPPPPVNGLGTIGGFKLQLEDRADLGDEALYAATQAVLAKARANPKLTGLFSSYEINVPQLNANIDRTKVKQLGVNINDVYTSMQVYLGSLYINDFNKFGHTYQVIAQADSPFRSSIDDILNIKVRSNTGAMIPLGSLMSVDDSHGPDRAMRYNLYRTSDINGGPAPGISTDEAQNELVKIIEETLPKGMGFEWTDLTYQQILAGNTAVLIFPLCVFLVFMVLAAQYENLILPLVIILIVPVVLFSALVGLWAASKDINVFTQIGLVVLVGLACKNAILIVEFARELELSGMSTFKAAMEASRLRLRPILMTSFAFIMGVVPLVFSSGAGFEMRNAIGTTVFSGMIGVTVLGIFITPMFYVLLRTLSGRKLTQHETADVAESGFCPDTLEDAHVKKPKGKK